MVFPRFAVFTASVAAGFLINHHDMGGEYTTVVADTDGGRSGKCTRCAHGAGGNRAVQESETVGSDVQVPFDFELEDGGEGTMRYVVEYNPHPQRRSFFQATPEVIVQYGSPRTASTLQFQALCASMILLYAEKVTCKYEAKLQSVYQAFSTGGNGMYGVFKTHDKDSTQNLAMASDGHPFWLFVTVFGHNSHSSSDDTACWEEPSCVAKILNVEPQFVQIKSVLRVRGTAIVADYAPIFGLSDRQTEQLLDYMMPWSVLRQCCGPQLSSCARKTLFGEAPSSGCPACDGQDLNAVESTVLKSTIFKKMRENKIAPDPLQVDPYLNGTYCTWYNRQIGCQHLMFNHKPEPPFC